MSYGAPFRVLRRMYAVTMRTKDYRYIQWQKDLGRGELMFQELYDHRVDPDEKDNLAESYPKVIERLSKRLVRIQADQN